MNSICVRIIMKIEYVKITESFIQKLVFKFIIKRFLNILKDALKCCTYVESELFKYLLIIERMLIKSNRIIVVAYINDSTIDLY